MDSISLDSMFSWGKLYVMRMSEGDNLKRRRMASVCGRKRGSGRCRVSLSPSRLPDPESSLSNDLLPHPPHSSRPHSPPHATDSRIMFEPLPSPASVLLGRVYPLQELRIGCKEQPSLATRTIHCQLGFSCSCPPMFHLRPLGSDDFTTAIDVARRGDAHDAIYGLPTASSNHAAR